MKEDIRWEQRFVNFEKALSQLKKFILKRKLSDLEEQGLIKSFEYTFELGWKTLKDYLFYQGQLDLMGSRDTIRESFKLGLIKDGEGWMDMLESRNQTSHSYNEKTAQEIVHAIFKDYYRLFTDLKKMMRKIIRK